MGQSASRPQPNTTLRVIGAGLPRTGTSSFNLALSHLLNGPSYHGGTQVTLGPPSCIKAWVQLLTLYPAQTPTDKATIQKILKQEIDGYVGVTDAPCAGLVEELLELYPDAIVICTTRDVDAWVKSMETIANAATLWFLNFVLYPLPTMRHFPAYIQGLRNQWIVMYGKAEPAEHEHWERHMAYLKRVVPPEKLVFFDVREGWEPLCKALGKEVPDVPFPRVNDSKAIEDLSKRMILAGLKRWAVVFGTIGVGIMSVVWARNWR